MKILVTGGAGFIGSNVVDAYIKAGHDVAVIDNLSSGKIKNINPKAKFYLLDIRSLEVKKVFELERPVVVNHHAAQMSVPASVEDPLYDADVNVKGFLNIIEASKTYNAKKVIFISSGGAIYGDTDEYPTSENAVRRPLSPYAITKAVAEDYLIFYNRQRGLDYTVLRYANIYGPRQIPHGEAGVVAVFMDGLLNKTPSAVYHFEDEPRGMTRDYCFVGDVVTANLLALTKGSGAVYNIGTGRPTHTLDLFDAIYQAVKERVPELPLRLATPGSGPARAGDIERSCLNVYKAGAELGWKSVVTLKRGIERTLDWRMKG
ncbi:MAG: NAD-dependent epimerase/dehydratase family protein [Deltaproteobacteria bacterium]|nr:NAD-dependent epimerase/dehydratase family protein [Deltaproteobacteria bacterium]